MNRNAKYRRLTLALAVLGVLLGVPGRDVLADGQNPDIVPPQQLVDGKSYSDWSAAWWQWLLAIPYGPPRPNPAGYSDGKHCEVNQSGPVWFLTGPGAGSVGGVTQQCKVPAGKYIILPLLTVECSTYETPPTGANCTDAKSCSQCAQGGADLIDRNSLKAWIDGVPVTGLQAAPSPFRKQSPYFAFSVPARNFFATDTPAVSGAGTGSSVSDGYWLMIKPLPPGPHTIQFQGNLVVNGSVVFGENVNYQITVTQP